MTTDNQESETEKALVKRQPIAVTERGVQFVNMDELFKFSDAIAKSQFCPSGWTNLDVAVALELGAEIGLRPTQSLRSIAVINGKPSIYGDVALGLVRASGHLASYEQCYEGEPYEDDYKAIVTVTRKGFAPMTGSFSVADAKNAGLWNKSGPWKQYPNRMLLFRARGFILRDAFGDVLQGLGVDEVDHEPQPGFEHAKLAAAKVVEPNFGSMVKTQEPPPGVASSSEEPQRPRRGRPPKSAAPAAEPQPSESEPQQSAPETREPEPRPESKQPEMPKVEPAPTAASAPRQESFFGERSTAAEIVRRLNQTKISQERFLEVLLDNDLIDCERGDITSGDFGLDKVRLPILEHALREWDKVLQILKQPPSNER